MLGFGEISELSHNLEDMLDKLRMGKITITRDLVDLLYDAVDSLNRLVISINDPSVAGLVDVSAQLPYFVSGGLVGLGLILVGLVVINLTVKHKEALDRKRQLEELRDALVNLRSSIESADRDDDT